MDLGDIEERLCCQKDFEIKWEVKEEIKIESERIQQIYSEYKEIVKENDEERIDQKSQ